MGLNKQFDSIITESDWQNIDLIIFNMTSGRADSFKESLILVDGVRQTEAIIGAIEKATASICKALYNGFSSLGSLITNSFDRLSNTIQVNLNNLRHSVDNIYSSNVRAQNSTEKLINQNEKFFEQTKRLITATELGNALQEKANETSYQLYSDLRYTSNIIKK